MEDESRYLRTADEALCGDDFGWLPNWGFCPDWESVRNQAIVEVARRLPNEAATVLNGVEFSWFIPGGEHGFAGVFPLTAMELYLSPELEKMEFDFAVACVAHELAHLCLGHPPFRGGDWKEKEAEAWDLVDKWGFELEAEKHRAWYANQ